MTPRERALGFMLKWSTHPNISQQVITQELFIEWLEEMITKAIEEEREANATIAEEEQMHWAFSPKEPAEHFKRIAQEIRARSNG